MFFFFFVSQALVFVSASLSLSLLKAQSFSVRLTKSSFGFFFCSKKEKFAMNGSEREEGVKMEECKETVVYMCGYIPGASPEKSPILSPVPVHLPDSGYGVDSWKDVCGGGCGFAMAISG